MQGGQLGQPGPALDGKAVIAFHQQCLADAGWPKSGIGPDGQQLDQPPAAGAGNAALLWHWVGNNHRFNSLLWDEEDLARRTRVSAEEIAGNKRAIDGYNQARNDATERVDELLLLALGLVDPASVGSDSPASLASPQARLNSETAGSIIDRMSIMALKVRAMQLQAGRTDVDEAHRAACRARLARLENQRDDLGRCLDELMADCRQGRACFKVYRQFKMYNDPAFNPALVAERGA